MITGEMEIGSIMAENSKSTKKQSSPIPPTLPRLPTLSRPFILNPEEFIFEDDEESDHEGCDIYAADTDPEALNAKTDNEDDADDEEETEDESAISSEEEDNDFSSVSYKLMWW